MSRAPPDKWQSRSSQDLFYRHLGAIIEIHHCAIDQLYLSLETIYPCFAAATLTSPRIKGINSIPMYWRAILLHLSSFNEHLLYEMNQLQSKAPIILAHHYFDRSFWSLECRVDYISFPFFSSSSLCISVWCSSRHQDKSKKDSNSCDLLWASEEDK